MSTTTRSVSAITARITCSTNTIVAPWSRILRISAIAPSISPGVRPHSTSSSRGAAGARRARGPARGTCAGAGSARRARPRLVLEAGELQPAARLFGRASRFSVAPPNMAATATFSSTVRCANGRGIW
jgi:hypothetical protein